MNEDEKSALPNTEGDKMGVLLLRSISRVIITQTAISGFLAILIIGVSAGIPVYNALNDVGTPDAKLPDAIENWGGIIIGFYFGSALTQMATLVSSLTGKNGAG